MFVVGNAWAAFTMSRNVNWLSPLHCYMTCRNIHKLVWIMERKWKRRAEGSTNFIVFVFFRWKMRSMETKRSRHDPLKRFPDITNTMGWKVKREIMKWHSRTTFIASYFSLEAPRESVGVINVRWDRNKFKLRVPNAIQSGGWLNQSSQASHETRFIVQSLLPP